MISLSEIKKFFNITNTTPNNLSKIAISIDKNISKYF